MNASSVMLDDPAARPPGGEGRESIKWAEENLIDRLLADQQRLQTPVVLFARKKEQGLRTDLFRHLIPLEKPGPGEQYAFEVDLDKCSGCKACVSACHSLNGLDEDEAWRDVGLLLGERNGGPFQQTVTTACHHCLDPACANGCPVLAYEKDSATGIVRHLDDQCIGCSYCILKCPYDVPKYSHRRGIVRKCDMCHGRLSAGEAPACVQACPHEAIRIVKISRREAAARVNAPLVPGAFDSRYTRPTTAYVRKASNTQVTHSRQVLLRPADATGLRVEEAHMPLAVMLVLTQVALGVSLAAWVFRVPTLWLVALVLAAVGGAASVLHLGQPLKAWRVFLGLRRSWLSREVVAFGPWVGLVALASALPLIQPGAPFFDWLPESAASLVGYLPRFVKPAVETAALVAGVVTVFCSMMVYIDTRRPVWSAPRTVFRFGSSVVLGFLAAWVCVDGAAAGWAAAALGMKLALEARALWRWSRMEPETPEARSAGVVLMLLSRLAALRLALAAVAGVLFFVQPIAAALCLVISEIFERRLFFQACPAPRMPGL